MSEWIGRDFTGRSLSANERRLVDVLGRLLDELRPGQLSAVESTAQCRIGGGSERKFV